jgi:hypothetical protein
VPTSFLLFGIVHTCCKHVILAQVSVVIISPTYPLLSSLGLAPEGGMKMDFLKVRRKISRLLFMMGQIKLYHREEIIQGVQFSWIGDFYHFTGLVFMVNLLSLITLKIRPLKILAVEYIRKFGK